MRPMTSNRPTGRRVWIGLEGSYAAGRLVGLWCDADTLDPDGVAELAGILHKMDPLGGDELSIMDTEGWGEVDPHAYPLGELSAVDALLSERPEAEALIAAHGGHYYRTAEAIEAGLDGVSIYGPYDSVEDYAWEMVDSGAIEVSESVRNWIDWEAMGRDLAMDASEVRTDAGLWLVFG